jgi:glycosyltransferase involved in cell wall biosynthesis
MRIAFVTQEYIDQKFEGGLANYIHRVALSLIELGHQPVVIMPASKAQTTTVRGIELRYVPTSKPPRWMRAFNRATRRSFETTMRMIWLSWQTNMHIRRLHQEQPFAIIQYPHIAGIALFRPREIPSVVRISGHLPLYLAAGAFQGPLYRLKQRELIQRWAPLRADSIFSPSSLMADVIAKEIGRPVRVIETPFVLETPITDDQLYRDLLHGKKYLLFFGKVGPLKGADVIGRMLPRLLARHPDLFFLFVGSDMKKQGQPMMQQIWEQAGTYRGRVLYLGKLSHSQLYPLIEHAYAVMLPSRVDNLPNACIEAMAHRRVVIGTRGASFEQLIVDGESGFLCPIADADSLLEATEHALHLTDAQRQQMGERAWERVQELRPEKVVNELLRFYEEVITRHRAARRRARQ